MKKLILFLLVIASISLPFYISCHDEHVAKVVRDCVENNKTLGISVAMIEGDKITFYSYGRLNRKSPAQVTENTLFDIGSVTKTITTMLMQIMVDKGLFNWDDSLVQHLPQGVDVPKIGDREITLLDLATHTSGFPYMADNCKMEDMNNPAKDYTVELLYEYLNTAQLKNKPGEFYDYSNLGIGLLGHIMTLKCHKSYEALVQEYICHPLSMNETTIILDEEQKLRFATGHIGQDEVANWDLPVIEGAGSLRSTTKDLSQIIAANLGTINTPLTEHFVKTHAKIKSIEDHNMALGWHVTEKEDSVIVWHNGQTGGYHSFMGFLPKQKKGVVLLTNSGANFDSIGMHLLDSQHKIEKDSEDIVLDPLILDQYVGTYKHFTGLTCYLWREGAQLKGRLYGHPAVDLFPESPSRFFLKVMDVQVQFIFDSYEKVKGINVFRGDQVFWIRRVY